MSRVDRAVRKDGCERAPKPDKRPQSRQGADSHRALWELAVASVKVLAAMNGV